MLIVVKWSDASRIDNTKLESYFSDFQERNITKYEVDWLGNAVKKDVENSHKFYGVIENNLIILINISIIHTDLPQHIINQDISEIYSDLSQIDDEIEIEIVGGDSDD